MNNRIGMLRGFLAGIVVTILAGVIGAVVVVQNGWVPDRADVPPGPIEKWAARSVYRAIRHESAGLESPIQPSDDNLTAGAKIYAMNCAVCHGASDGAASAIASGLNVKPPQFAKHGVDDDPPSETYYKVKHGVKFTGMPAFGDSLTDEQAWQVALFLKTLDKLTPRADAAWKAIPSEASAAPAAVTPVPAASSSSSTSTSISTGPPSAPVSPSSPGTPSPLSTT